MQAYSKVNTLYYTKNYRKNHKRLFYFLKLSQLGRLGTAARPGKKSTPNKNSRFLEKESVYWIGFSKRRSVAKSRFQEKYKQIRRRSETF